MEGVAAFAAFAKPRLTCRSFTHIRDLGRTCGTIEIQTSGQVQQLHIPGPYR